MPNLPEPPASKILVHRMRIPIRWGDMDAMGHVNNTVYFRYMETIRLAWFDALGLQLSAEVPGPVIIYATCTFVRQFTYPGIVDARHYVGDFGRSSVDTWIELSRSEAPDQICAHGSAKVVWADMKTERSAPIPDAVRAAMSRPWAGADAELG